MLRLSAVHAVAVVCLLRAYSSAFAQENAKSYPITFKADDVHEIAELSLKANGLTLTAKNVLVVPIRCEVGITGAMLLGSGEFCVTPADGDEIKGNFRATMLRFNPADQSKLLPLEKATLITDRGAYEMSQHLLNGVFGHCWHSGRDALIPDAKSLAADVYSKTHGDLLISTGEKSTVVFNFTSGKKLYEKK